MTKLVIQIPCLDEGKTLGATLQALPKALPGIDSIEIVIIDDGSTDDTVAVARAHGVSRIVSMHRNQGLARAFMAGIEESLRADADIVVNTDADNQYSAADIGALVAPILDGRADMVVGARPISDIGHFSPIKKTLQALGSWVVRLASNTNVADAPSGFRAFSREAAEQLNVFSNYTYTLETLIQAGRKGMAVLSVPVRVNQPTRPSRLIRSIGSYVRQSIVTIVRIFIIYKPFRFFAWLGSIVFLAGAALGVRFLYFYVTGSGSGHIQSLILASMLMSMGFIVVIAGILADLIAVNRVLLERIDMRLRRLERRDDRR